MSFNAIQGISSNIGGSASSQTSQTMSANATDAQHFSNKLNTDSSSKIPAGMQNAAIPQGAMHQMPSLAQQNMQGITSGGSTHAGNNASSTGQAHGNFGGNHGGSSQVAGSNASSTGQAHGNFGGNSQVAGGGNNNQIGHGGNSGDKGQVAGGGSHGGNNSQIGGNGGDKGQVAGGGNHGSNNSQIGGNGGNSGDKGQVAGGGNNSQIGGNGDFSSHWQFGDNSKWQTSSSLTGKFA